MRSTSQTIASLKSKNDSPIGMDGDRPKASQIAFQRMQMERLDVQVPCALRHIQRGKNEPDAAQVLGRNPSRVVFFV